MTIVQMEPGYRKDGIGARICSALVAMTFAGTANALISRPVFDEPLVEGAPVIFSISGDTCDVLITAAAPPASDAWRTVERVGNTLRVTVTADLAEGTWCNAHSAAARFSIGTLPAGTYTLELYRRNYQDPASIALLWSVEFIVAATMVHAVPALGARAQVALGLVLLLSFGHARRRKAE